MKRTIKIKVKTKLPRGKVPPPSKVFKDRKKEANKKWTREKGDDDEN